jgi:hypothetical protein
VRELVRLIRALLFRLPFNRFAALLGASPILIGIARGRTDVLQLVLAAGGVMGVILGSRLMGRRH